MTKHNLTVSLDYDSTLVDLDTPWDHWMNEQFGFNLVKQEVTDWGYLERTFGSKVFGFFNNNKVYDMVEPLPGAKAFVKAVSDMVGDDSVFIVTTTPENLHKNKSKHIKDVFGIDESSVVFADTKHHFTDGSILVDDNPHQITGHVFENRCPGILFNLAGEYGWSHFNEFSEDDINRHSDMLVTCHTYEQVLTHIEKILEVM